MQTLVFAPDWTISALNVSGLPDILKGATGVGNPLTKSQINSSLPVDQKMYRYWPAFGAIVLVGVPTALQSMIYMLFGDDDQDDYPFPWQNEAGYVGYMDITPIIRLIDKDHKFGGITGHRRTYLRFGKQALEVFRWITDPTHSMMSKSSMTSKIAMEQVLSKNSAWWDMPWVNAESSGFFHVDGEFAGSRAAAIAEKFVPLSLLSLLQDRPSTFFAPTKQGTSKYVAVEKMSKLLSAFADKGVSAELNKNGALRKTTHRVVADYLEAVRRNGYDPKKVMQEAMSKARGRHNLAVYQELRKKSPSDRVLIEESENLRRLNGSLTRNLFRSLEQRFDIGNRKFDSEYRRKVSKAWRAARKGESTFETY